MKIIDVRPRTKCNGRAMKSKSRNDNPGRRVIKRRVRAALEAEDFDRALEDLLAGPPRPLCSPLISFLASGDERLKSRAVSALGAVVARVAGEDMEAARNIVRRLNWSLTEEAGAIGWGAPEAIGEILARHEGLAREFIGVLLSYVQEINLLDHPPLLGGALRGIARLAKANPELAREHGAAEALAPHASSNDPTLRRLARRAIETLGTDPSNA